MSSESTDLGAGAFMRVLRGLLRPLVRTMISRGVTLPAFHRLMKELYVASAEQDFQIDGQRPTDSRISLLTGVHRRDVRTLRGAQAAESPPAATTLLATVIGQWLADPSLRGPGGTPLALPRAAESGPSFEALVRTLNRDVRPRTVLDELMRQGVVAEDKDGLLHLRAEVVIGPADLDQKILYFAANVGDHLSAAAENLLTDPPPFFERALFYNRLSPGSIDEIEARARTNAQDMLVELNALANGMQDVDAQEARNTGRFRFGLYFYRTEDGDAPAGGAEET